MSGRIDYNAAFKSLAKEFNDTLGIPIERTKEIKMNGRVERVDRSRIVRRLEHLCVKDQKISDVREYHLCRMISHTFTSHEPKQKKQLARNLLTDDCIIELMPLVSIMKDDEEGIFDLRAAALKEPLTVEYLSEQITTLFEMNDQHYIYTKRPDDQKHIEPVNGSMTIENKDCFDTQVLFEYITLCHALENNRLLLDLDIRFLCGNDLLSKQLVRLHEMIGAHLQSDIDVRILNELGADMLFTDDGPRRINQFFQLLKRLKRGYELVHMYGALLIHLPEDYVEQNEQLMWETSENPVWLIKRLLNDRVLFEVVEQQDPYRLHSLITVDALLKNQIDDVRMLLETPYFTDKEWLTYFKQSKPPAVLRDLQLKTYIDNGIARHGTAEKWLISVDVDMQHDLFLIMENHKVPINYLVLYAACLSLRDIPRIQQAYTENKSKTLSQIRVRNIFIEMDQKQVEPYRQCFSRAQVEAKALDWVLHSRMYRELSDYRDRYLTIDQRGIATASWLTPNERAAAFNRIAYLLGNRAINPDQLSNDLLHPEFMRNIGDDRLTSRRPLTFLRPLIEWANQYKAYQKTRVSFCERVSNNDGLLLELLLDVDILNNLTAQELKIIFLHGNKALFAEAIVRGYPDAFKTFEWNHEQVDVNFLRSIVPLTESPFELDRVNHLRARHRIPLYIPIGSKYSGIHSGDAALDKASLYQLQDSDIAVGEDILLEEFQNRLSMVEIHEPAGEPKWIQLIDPIVSQKQEVMDQKHAGPKVYLIPMNAAQAVLIDPAVPVHPHRRTYQVFVQNMRLIMDRMKEGRDHLLMGIANLNANHYVPYFINRNAKGVVTVLTVDPSYQTSPILKRCFEHIFPGCRYQDADIVQQVRQRDCGFNSLQVIADVMQLIDTAIPVISIDHEGLRILSNRLTINGTAYRCHDPVRNEDFFLKEFMRQGELNRQRWAVKLRQKNSVRYSREAVLQYDYAYNVEHQEAQDVLDEKLSVVTALMIGLGNSLDQFREQYRNDLLLPTPKQLLEIRNQLIAADDLTPEISALLEGQAGIDVINTVCKINFRQDTEIGLTNFFTHYFLPRCTLNKESTPESVVLLFAETQQYAEFSKLLSERELAAFCVKIHAIAAKQMASTVLELKARFVIDHMKMVSKPYLKQTPFCEGDVGDKIIEMLREDKHVKEDVRVLSSDNKARVELMARIRSEVNERVNRYQSRYKQLLEQRPEVLLKNQILIQGTRLIDVAFLEKEFGLESTSECKPISADAQLEVSIRHESMFQQLISRELFIQHVGFYMQGIKKQLTMLIDRVINHPLNKAVYQALHASNQIKQDDYLAEFLRMANVAGIHITVDGETVHDQMLSSLIVGKLPVYFNQLMAKRWQTIMHQVTVSDCLEAKGQLQALVQKKPLLQSGEYLFDFVYVYQASFAQTTNAIVKLMEQWIEIENVMNHAYSCKLFTQPIVDALAERIHSFRSQFKTLSPTQAVLDSQDKRQIQVFFDLMRWLMDDVHYQMGSVSPDTHTFYARRILCHAFQFNCPVILSQAHAMGIDKRLKSRIAMPPSRSFLLESDVWLPIVKRQQQLDCKQLPLTDGRPLTPQMILHCLTYWRAHDHHAEDDPMYRQLSGLITLMPPKDFDAEISQREIRFFKELLSEVDVTTPALAALLKTSSMQVGRSLPPRHSMFASSSDQVVPSVAFDKVDGLLMLK